MDIPNSILLANAASTWFMTGLIWMVQGVHYPLFAFVGGAESSHYQRQHQTRTSLVVGPPMLVEAISTILLASYPPANCPRSLIVTGIGLLTIVWLSTAFIQVPCHQQLENGFDRSAHRRLVGSNWIRTIGWTARSVLVCSMLILAMK